MSTGSTSVKSHHDRDTFCANNVDSGYEVDADMAAWKSKKRKASRRVSSRDLPIIIDDSNSPNGSQGLPKKQRTSRPVERPFRKIPTFANDFIHVRDLLRSSENHIVMSGAGISTNTAVPTFQEMWKSKHSSLQQLGCYDDMLTDTLVDGIYYTGVTRKYNSLYSSTDRDQQSVISILRDLVIKERDLLGAECQLLALPNLKIFLRNLKSATEKDNFRRHMRRYVSVYLPDCPFNISDTNQYVTTHEANVIARKQIGRGEEIKYLCGIRAVLTEEEDDLDRRAKILVL